MTKQELKDKIKMVVNRVYPDIQKPPLKYSEEKKIYIIPELRNIVIELFTLQYNIFLRKIEWVSPNPTTFRLVLNNNNHFYLTWMSYYWKCEILGKTFLLNDVPQKLLCTKYLTDLLKYSNAESKEGEDSDSNVDDILGGESDNEIEDTLEEPEELDI